MGAGRSDYEKSKKSKRSTETKKDTDRQDRGRNAEAIMLKSKKQVDRKNENVAGDDKLSSKVVRKAERGVEK